jgi:hypothetical protein
MTAFVLLVAFILCVTALVYHLRAWREKLRQARIECARTDHLPGWRHFYAFDDPRYPVKECKGCGLQHHLQPPIPCPHCGEDVRTPPGATQAVRLSTHAMRRGTRRGPKK